MNPTIVAASIGALSGALTSALGLWLSLRRMRAERNMRHQVELAKKQIEACEALWSVLEPFSPPVGQTRVVKDPYEEPKVIPATAEQLNQRIMEVFHSPAGLYFSRDLRKALFGLRNFVRDELVDNTGQAVAEAPISKSLARRFRRSVTRLRVALRSEVGVEDLRVGKVLGGPE